jgi:hypothetical protein
MTRDEIRQHNRKAGSWGELICEEPPAPTGVSSVDSTLLFQRLRFEQNCISEDEYRRREAELRASASIVLHPEITEKIIVFVLTHRDTLMVILRIALFTLLLFVGLAIVKWSFFELFYR